MNEHKTTTKFFAVFFVGILAFATASRLWKIGTFPKGLHNDEASFLANTLSIMQTGKDEDGRLYPWYLHSFIDPKPALYSYLQMPFVNLFGPTTAASRLPSALFGIASLPLVYLILKKHLSPGFSLIVVALLSISPWHIMNSRATQEVITSFFFLLVSVATLQHRVSSKKHHFFSFVILFLSSYFSMYVYHSAKITLPLLLLSYSIIFFEKKSLAKTLVCGIAVGFAFVLSTIFGGFSRMNAVGFFSDRRPQLLLEEQLRAATPYTHPTLNRMFHNKYGSYAITLLERYGLQFTTDTLFIKGADPKRYIVPTHGLLYLIELPLLLFGIFASLYSKALRKFSMFMVSWMLISPIPSALTWQEIPSSVRPFPMVVPLMFFVAFSIYSMLNLQKSRMILLLSALIALYFASFIYFWHQFTIQQTYLYPWNRNVADEQLVAILPKYVDKFDAVVVSRSVSGQPYIYFLLKQLMPFSQMYNNYPQRTKDRYTIGKYTFWDTPCPVSKSEHTLFVTQHNCPLSSGYKILENAGFDDGLAQYDLVMYDKSLDTSLNDSLTK